MTAIAKLVLFLLLALNPGKNVNVEQQNNIITITIDGQEMQFLQTEIKEATTDGDTLIVEKQ